jgi:hypothetical protein
MSGSRIALRSARGAAAAAGSAVVKYRRYSATTCSSAVPVGAVVTDLGAGDDGAGDDGAGAGTVAATLGDGRGVVAPSPTQADTPSTTRAPATTAARRNLLNTGTL